MIDWNAYLEGQIARMDRTPDSVVRSFEEWFDGARSAMRQFVLGKAVKPVKLQFEISTCLANNLQGDAEQQRLLEAQRWIIREGNLATASRDLVDAMENFRRAVKTLGLDDDDTAQLMAAIEARAAQAAETVE